MFAGLGAERTDVVMLRFGCMVAGHLGKGVGLRSCQPAR